MKKIILLLAVISLSMACGRVSEANFSKEKECYTRYNIHTQHRRGSYTANYSGWVGLGANRYVLPAGSKVKMLSSRKAFYVLDLSDNKVITYQFHAANTGMSTAEYIEAITSETPVTFDTLSEADKKGIKEGKVSVGMTKAGVLATYGIPPKHRTSSTDLNEWRYWKSKFPTTLIYFDDSGKVTKIK